MKEFFEYYVETEDVIITKYVVFKIFNTHFN